MDPSARDNPAVILKYAEMDVIVPARGNENAKFVKGPAMVPVRSIFAPRALSVGAELPNPIKPPVPAAPPTRVVNATGIPDANGITVPAAVAPVAPVAPVGPRSPWIPWTPVAPVAPVGPGSP